MLISDSENEEDENNDETDATRSNSSNLSDAIDLTNIPSALPRQMLAVSKMDSIISIVRYKIHIFNEQFQISE